MKYCKQVMIDMITNQLDQMESNKLMIRIESFDNAKLYWELREYFHEECVKRQIKFDAKITLQAWERLKERYPYETKQLENYGVLDNRNRITYYRNEVAEKKTFLLLFGTEYAEDKAGLNELFYINPSIIDAEVGEQYSKLFEKYDWLMEKEKKRLDNYYHQLFLHVGKNVLYLSDLVDQLPDSLSNFEELMEILFSSSYAHWKMPNMLGQDISKVKEKGKIAFFDKASAFAQRKNFDKIATAKGYVKKIQDYAERLEKYAIDWPAGTGFSSYEEFAKALTNYIYGQEIEKYRDLLCSMPFEIINTVLEFKVPSQPKSKRNQAVKLYDEPFLMLAKTITYALAQEVTEEFDTFTIQVERIGIAGVYGEENQEDTEQKVKEIWQQVCYYAGGLLYFFNNKLSASLENRKVEFEDEDIFDINNLEELWYKGILCTLSTSNKLSSVKYQVILKNQGEPLKNGMIKSEWKFSEYDGWFNTFTEFTHGFLDLEEDAYLPFGIVKKIGGLVQAQEMEDFYHALSYTEIEYRNVLQVFERRFGNKYPWLYEKYTQLAYNFMCYVGSIVDKGFFGTMESDETEQLLSCYKHLAEELFELDADEQLLGSYPLFLNSFLISDSEDGIEQDIEISHAIVPSYHPSTIEKLQEKMVYIAGGMKEIFESLTDGTEKRVVKKIVESIDLLDERSTVCSAVDVIKGRDKLLVTDKMHFSYAVYSDYQFREKSYERLDFLQNSIEYDEDYDVSQFKTMTAESKMMCRYISEYINTFPMARETLNIAAVHYDNFQPIIAALHYMTQEKKSQIKNLNLYIYMPKEKNGGQGYLSYWVNNFFHEDSQVNIQIYLNYYEKERELEELFQNKNMDLLFLKNILVEEDVDFSSLHVNHLNEKVKFPMIYKPLPMSESSKKREVEVSQLQFLVASAHTKLMYRYLNRNRKIEDIQPMVVRSVRMDKEKLELVESLHKKAGWVVCMDMGMDKKILYNYDQTEKTLDYRMIGFSTGEGAFGEYNVTVSARNDMVMDLKERAKQKLTRVFGRWDDEQLEQAASYCVNMAKDLDGSSLLKALNPNDDDINNFLAYVLTNEYVKEKRTNSDYQILISLDSYKHWFRGVEDITTGTLEKYPDFLYLTIQKGDYGREDEDIAIQATLIECKLANENKEHLEKAYTQISNGFKILQERFCPDSEKMDSRFWFLQLYRVLVFSQIQVENNREEFNMLAREIIGILDGHFKIQWSGEIYTFWRDMDQNTVTEVSLENVDGKPVKQVVFGQQKIKQMLTGKSEMLTDSFEIVLDEEELKKREREEEEMEKSEQSVQESEWFDEQGKESETSSNNETSPTIQEQHTTEQKEEQVFSDKTDVTRQETDMQKQQEINILLGESKQNGERICWNYTNKNMGNRHLLITGKSGQGKTYAIQGFLLECSRAGIPMVIVDYTEGFTTKKLNDLFKEQMGDKIKQKPVKYIKMPINPFERHKVDIHEILDDDVLDMLSEEEIRENSMEDAVAVSTRLADILTHVYDFGPQQYAAIYAACKSGLEKYSADMNFEYFRQELENINSKEAKSVLTKLTPFLDTDLFNTKATMDWGDMLYNNGTVNVIQLTQIPRDMQIAVTEFILWDMWYYSVLNGEEKNPFIVVLDEAQNLDFGEKSVANKILTEGRKFGWSGWFATQFLKGQLKEDEIGRLYQASQRVYFRPPDNELVSMAQSIDQDRSHTSDWVNRLKNLNKGECVVSGDSIFGTGVQKKYPVQLMVSSMEKRMK